MMVCPLSLPIIMLSKLVDIYVLLEPTSKQITLTDIIQIVWKLTWYKNNWRKRVTVHVAWFTVTKITKNFEVDMTIDRTFLLLIAYKLYACKHFGDQISLQLKTHNCQTNLAKHNSTFAVIFDPHHKFIQSYGLFRI